MDAETKVYLEILGAVMAALGVIVAALAYQGRGQTDALKSSLETTNKVSEDNRLVATSDTLAQTELFKMFREVMGYINQNTQVVQEVGKSVAISNGHQETNLARMTLVTKALEDNLEALLKQRPLIEQITTIPTTVNLVTLGLADRNLAATTEGMNELKKILTDEVIPPLDRISLAMGVAAISSESVNQPTEEI